MIAGSAWGKDIPRVIIDHLARRIPNVHMDNVYRSQRIAIKPKAYPHNLTTGDVPRCRNSESRQRSGTECHDDRLVRI